MYGSVTVGRSNNAITLFVPKAPPVDAAPELKAQVFDFLSDLLHEHRLFFSAAELISAFATIPCNNYAASQEASLIAGSLRAAFFQVANLTGLGFCDSSGAAFTSSSATITDDPATRPEGLSFFAFRATVDPITIDNRIHHLQPLTIEYLLPLPQSTTTNTTSTVTSPTIATTATTNNLPASNTTITTTTTSPARRLSVQFATPGRATTTATTTSPARAAVAAIPTQISGTDIDNMDATTRAALATATGTDTLADYSADAFSKFTATELQFLVLRGVPTTTTTAPITTTTATTVSTLSSPKMKSILQSQGGGGFSYRGSLEFLEDQAIFNEVFPNPIPTAANPADGDLILSTITTFVDRARFLAFVPIFRTDYVGTSDRNDAMSLSHIIKAIKRLAMATRNPTNGAWTNLSPDELFAEYSALTPMLPANVALWGLNLVSQFHDGLSPEIQELLGDDPRYQPPNLASLVTKPAQLTALRDIRVAAVRIHASIRKQEGLIARTVTRRMKQTNTHTITANQPHEQLASNPAPSTLIPQQHTQSQPPHSVTTYVSPAESTMQRYQPQAPATYPVDPATGFTSPHPVGHRGCMLCGSNEHVFSSCPRRNEPGAKESFFQNLFAHKPQLRKLPARPSEIIPGFIPQHPTQAFPIILSTSHTPENNIVSLNSLPPTSPNPFKTAPLTTATERSSLTAIAPAPTQPPPAAPAPQATAPSTALSPALKRTRFFVQTVQSFSHQINLPAVIPPMPIAIDNGLPHITLQLGTTSSSHALSGLMDTCGALNTGYLPYHQWVMASNPSLVSEYLEFDDTHPFEPIKLGGAIKNPDGFDSDIHGRLTAVIRYHTQYTTIDGDAVTISFALGPDVTVNTIFGLPMLSDFDSNISLGDNTLHSKLLDCRFPITRQAPDHGLPSTANFMTDHKATLCRPKVHTNLQWEDIPKPKMIGRDDVTKGFLRRFVEPLL